MDDLASRSPAWYSKQTGQMNKDGQETPPSKYLLENGQVVKLGKPREQSCFSTIET